MKRWIVPLVCLASVAACDKKEPSPTPAASAAAPDLGAKYAAMTPDQRVRAARSACLVGDDCDPKTAEALLGAAKDAKERESLAGAARPAFASQYQRALDAKGKKADAVVADGDKLVVKGSACTRFLLENFLGGAEHGSAKALGFRRIECDSKALKAGADL
ncbi:MAG: hypothetical protein KC776_34330 [Myxococcales bacterium]|nr:hypothetical protein [Myxococcales bacterium]MCB9583568.1 hypothetical protein [Polyangiaceae bacterium]